VLRIATIGVERVLVVKDRELHRQLHYLRLGAPLGLVQHVEPVEDPALIQLVDVLDHLHEKSQAPTADSDALRSLLLHSPAITERCPSAALSEEQAPRSTT
jgi:hypothetical protein